VKFFDFSRHGDYFPLVQKYVENMYRSRKNVLSIVNIQSLLSEELDNILIAINFVLGKIGKRVFQVAFSNPVLRLKTEE
jgi:hypothetical protein